MCILVYVFVLFSSCVMVIRPPSPGLLVSPLPRCSITPQGASMLPGAPTFITSSPSSDVELILFHQTFTMLQIKVTLVGLKIKIRSDSIPVGNHLSQVTPKSKRSLYFSWALHWLASPYKNTVRMGHLMIIKRKSKTPNMAHLMTITREGIITWKYNTGDDSYK